VTKVTKKIIGNSVVFLTYLLIFLLPIAHLLPILKNDISLGWDLLPHLGIYSIAEEVFLRGHVVEYTKAIGAGIPLFGLYSPGPYLLIFLVRGISFFSISQEFAFNISLVLIPLFVIHGFHYAVRWIVGFKHALYATIIFLAYIFSPIEYSNLGLSIFGEIRGGMFGSFLGFGVLFYLFGALLRDRSLKHRSTFLLSAILASSLMYIHLLSAVSAVLAAGIWFLFDRPFRKRLAGIVCLAGIFSLPAILSMYQFMPYHSSEPIAGSGGTSEPFASLLPGVFSPQPWSIYSFSLDRIISLFGVASLAALFFLGVVHTIQKQKKLLIILILCLVFGLFFSRSIFYNLFPISIHCYRLQNIFLLCALFLIAHGFRIGFKEKNIFLRCAPIFAVLYALYISASFTISTPARYMVDAGFVFEGKHSFNPVLSQREKVKDLYSLSNYISNLKDKNSRIAVESTITADTLFGSPHALMGYLSFKNHDIETVPTLLAESSLCGNFILPLVNSSESLFQWGQVSKPELLTSSFDSTLDRVERLKYLGIDALVTSSLNSTSAVREYFNNTPLKEKYFGSISYFPLASEKSAESYTSQRYTMFISLLSTTTQRVKKFRRFIRIWWGTSLYKKNIDIIFQPDLKLLPNQNSIDAISRLGIQTFLADDTECLEVKALLEPTYKVICSSDAVKEGTLESILTSNKNLNVFKYGYSPNSEIVRDHAQSFIVAPCFTGTF
jgi:hypothetical protein